MDFDDPRHDTEAILVEDEGNISVSNGKIVAELDEQGNDTGFKLFVPTEEEQRRMEQYIAEELEIGEQEYETVRNRILLNIAAYEALPSGDKEDLLNLPLGKSHVNHLVAFFTNRIWNKDPIASVIPEEYGMYDVPIPYGRDPVSGAVLSRIEQRSAEELVEGGERLMTHYLKGDRLKFRAFIYTVIMDVVRGAAPAWGKTCYERVMRPQLVPNWRRLPNDMIAMDGYREVDRVVGSPHKMLALSGLNVMMASPWLDPQEADWVAEHIPHTVAEGRNKVKQNEWYLVSDDDWTDLRKAAGDISKRYEEKTAAAEMRERQAQRPRPVLDVHNVWLYWPVVFDDDRGQTLEGIFSLLVPFERTTGKMLAAPLNPYAHGRRNLVPYVQRPRPHEIGGYSTMEDVGPLQKVKTRLFHSQVQNAMLANTVWTKVRLGSTAWQWLKSNEIRSRAKVPVTNDTDLKAEVLGRELRSLAPEIAALDGWAKELTVSDTVKGAQLLGRTSRAAISLVQEAGLTIPNMDLDCIRDRASENLTMLFHNIGQWSVYGEEIPFRDPETRAIAMRAVRFPIDGLSGFSVRITASSDEETAQFEFERDLGLAKLQMEAFASSVQLIAPMMKPDSPPVVEEMQKPMFVAQQLLLARIFELAKMDPKKFTFTERQIDEILARHRAWVIQQQQKMMAEQAQQGGPGGPANVVQGAFGGGPVPNAGGNAP